MKLSVKGCALTFGIMWVITIAWAYFLILIGKGTMPQELISQFYLGWLAPTVGGFVLAIVIGFIDAVIFGVITALVYNKIAK